MPSKMTIVVLDTETTGMSETDQVCEFAWVEVEVKETRRNRIVQKGRHWTGLVNPNCPVSAEARATHHIKDEELVNAPSMDQYVKLCGQDGFSGLSVLKNSSSEVILAAHHLEFDYRMLVQSGVPDAMLPRQKICTLRCARHIFSDAPRYSNQVLRYYLNLDVSLSGPMHRALPDVVVTSALLMKMLETHSVEELIRLTTAPYLIKMCSFGEHAGKPWSEVDPGFLKWLLSKGVRRSNPKGGRDVGFDADTRYTCQYWLENRKG